MGPLAGEAGDRLVALKIVRNIFGYKALELDSQCSGSGKDKGATRFVSPYENYGSYRGTVFDIDQRRPYLSMRFVPPPVARLPLHSSSASRLTAGAAGFLILSQWLTRRFPKIVDAVAQPPVRLHEFDHRI